MWSLDDYGNYLCPSGQRSLSFVVEASVTQSEEGWTLVVSQLQGIPALAQLHQRLFAATGASCDGGPNPNHYFLV